MLAESALCLTYDTDKLSKYYGIVTPAVAMGTTLRQILEGKDFQFFITNEETILGKKPN